MLVSGHKKVVTVALVPDRAGLVRVSVPGLDASQVGRVGDIPWRETEVSVVGRDGQKIEVELSLSGLTLSARCREEVIYLDENGQAQKSLDVASWGNPR
jgi:hypothetical protein